MVVVHGKNPARRTLPVKTILGSKLHNRKEEDTHVAVAGKSKEMWPEKLKDLAVAGGVLSAATVRE